LTLLILIAGLIVYFVTEYDTLGIVLSIIGGVLFALQVLFFAIMAVAAVRTNRSYTSRIW
jgi:hypothetical protein